jgi:hypothetical protein
MNNLNKIIPVTTGIRDRDYYTWSEILPCQTGERDMYECLKYVYYDVALTIVLLRIANVNVTPTHLTGVYVCVCVCVKYKPQNRNWRPRSRATKR